jgi:hypothetical protein
VTVEVYLEKGRRRVFAGAHEWPGWCRSGRDEEAALATMVAAAPRYARALGRKVAGFEPPADPTALEVVERLPGDATTDFGAPGQAPSIDDAPLDDAETERLATILSACWSTFDRTARKATGARLTRGPRGGGRELPAIVDHVRDAEGAYLTGLGGDAGRVTEATMAAIRRAFLEALRIRAGGGDPPKPRRSGRLWSPRYAVRRSAWHALDHAWEIEDRSAADRR